MSTGRPVMPVGFGIPDEVVPLVLEELDEPVTNDGVDDVVGPCVVVELTTVVDEDELVIVDVVVGEDVVAAVAASWPPASSSLSASYSNSLSFWIAGSSSELSDSQSSYFDSNRWDFTCAVAY